VAGNFMRAFGMIDPRDSYMTANTSLLFHGGRLLALQESDFPYAVRCSLLHLHARTFLALPLLECKPFFLAIAEMRILLMAAK
jgi:Retinal pigment epithelial membrane protein